MSDDLLPHADGLDDLISETTITKTERRWLYVMASMLGVMLAIVVLTGVTQMLHPMSDVETIDARAFTCTASLWRTTSALRKTLMAPSLLASLPSSICLFPAV